MNTYPASPAPSRGTGDSDYLPLIQSESEFNYVKTRRKTTVSRKEFIYTYPNLTLVEYNILNAFFLANQGLEFTFIDPVTAISYTCVFSMDRIGKRYTDNIPKLITTKMEFQEVG